MKKISVRTAVFVLLLFAVVNWAYAENRVALSVSCTIPEIPGVNAPLLVVIADPHPRLLDNEPIPQQNQQEQSAPVIQEETKDQNQDREGELVLVKTFYAR